MTANVNKHHLNKRHILLAGLAGVGALAAGIMTANRKSDATVGGLTELWTLTLESPSGAQMPLSQFKGKPLLLNFWATWCAPCIEEMPLLNQFYHENYSNAPNSMQLLGIAADKAESVLKFLKTTRIQFPIAIANFEGVTLSQRLGNAKGGLPFSILIGKDGNILYTKEGQLTTNDLKMIRGLIGRY